VNPHQQNIEAGKFAFEAISKLRELVKDQNFQYFMGRLGQRADLMADAILHDESLSPEEREKTRQKRLELLEIMAYPEEQITTQERIIKAIKGDAHGTDLPD
jgi:hypothetical protein